MNDYKDRIAMIRAITGLTQAEIAAQIGVTQSTLGRWENGSTSPSGLAAQALEKFLRKMEARAS